MPENRQTRHHGIFAVEAERLASSPIKGQIVSTVEAEQVGARAIHHPFEAEPEQDPWVSADEAWPLLLICPDVLQLQQSISAALAIQAKDQGIDIPCHGATELAQIVPVVFFNADLGVDPPNFEALSPGEGPVVQLQQQQVGFSSLTPAGSQHGHRQLPEGVEAGNGCDLAAEEALGFCRRHRLQHFIEQNYSAFCAAMLRQRAKSSGVSISGPTSSSTTGLNGGQKRLPQRRKAATRMA